jgi:hypothetical protein
MINSTGRWRLTRKSFCGNAWIRSWSATASRANWPGACARKQAPISLNGSIISSCLPRMNSRCARSAWRPDRVETPGGETVLHHPRATLPRVVLAAEPGRMALSLRPEFVAEFVAAHSLAGPIEGAP